MDEFKFCRVCLVTDVRMIELETESSDSIGVFYSDLVQEQISDEKQHVCFECASLLHKCQEFKSKCLRAHKILSAIKLISSEITMDTLKSVDRKMNNLESNLEKRPLYLFFEEGKTKRETELNTNEDKENNDFFEVNVKTEETCIVIEEYLKYENRTDIDPKYEYNEDSTEDYNDFMEESVSETVAQPKQKINHDIEPNANKRKFVKNEVEDDFNLNGEMEESVSEITAQPEIKKRKVMEIMGEDDSNLSYQMSDSVSKIVTQSTKTSKRNKKPKLKKKPVLKIMGENDFKILEEMEESVPKTVAQTKKRSNRMEKSVSKSEAKSKQKRKQPETKKTINNLIKKNNSFDYSYFDDYATVVFMTPKEARKELLLRKQSKNYKKSPLKCDLCYIGYELKVTYESHLKRHSPENGDFECDICFLRFPQKVYLRKHKMFCHQKKFSCKLCTFVCYRTDIAKTHVDMHKGLKYLCKYCGEEFSLPNSLQLHYRLKHLKEIINESVCQFCGDIFSSLKGLKAHTLQLHKKDKNEKLGPECTDCGVHFTSEMAWKRHLVLSAKHKVSISCKFCGETFPKEDHLKAHLKKHSRQTINYNNIKVPAACAICDKWLATRDEYSIHMVSEHPNSDEAEKFLGVVEKPFVCEQCGEMYKRKSTLQNHQRKHTGERPFKCPECESSFRMSTALAVHMQRHSNLKPHKCEICGRSFRFKCILDRHMKIHLNIRPYSCMICDKTFINACDVKWHTIHVHEKVPRPTPKKKSAKMKTVVEDEENE